MNPPTRQPRHVSEILPEAFRDILATLTPRQIMQTNFQTRIEEFTASDAPGPDEMAMLMEEYSDADDEPEGIELGGIEGIPRDALARLLRFLLPSSASLTSPTFWPKVDLKIAAVAWLILPEFRQFPQEFLAKSIGKTRAAMSHHVTTMRDASGIDCRGGKTQRARRILSEAQRLAWRKRHEAEHSDEPENRTELETIFADETSD